MREENLAAFVLRLFNYRSYPQDISVESLSFSARKFWLTTSEARLKFLQKDTPLEKIDKWN